MCVGFLYTVVSSVPSGFLLIRPSRKDSSRFSFWLSTVNLIASLMVLMCTRNLRATYFNSITKVSSTYRFQIFGGRLIVVIAMFSKFSIKMSATTGDNGKPMGSHSFCTYITLMVVYIVTSYFRRKQ